MPVTELPSPDACVDAVIERVGRRLVVGTPLGAGKPNHLLNALYGRAKQDSSIDLTIVTALTLQRPTGGPELQRRLAGPIVERVFGNYPDLDYELDRVARALPDNVRVIEFYFAPAKYVGDDRSQRDYISSNYTHAARDIMDRGVNVLLQQVAERPEGLSLSCNPDLTVDLMQAMRQAERPVAFAAQVNDELPFMYGDAEVAADDFDFIVRDPAGNYTLFGPPKAAVSPAEHSIGLRVSALVRDGGELQIGIGALGDAIVAGLLMRHERPDDYARILDALDVPSRSDGLLQRIGGTRPFEQGLFAASEMLVDGFLDLFERGVIKRRVHDDLHLQRLLNRGEIGEAVTSATLDALIAERAIGAVLTEADVRYLQRFGIFREDFGWDGGSIALADGRRLSPDLRDADNRASIERNCLGTELTRGAVMHGGFFLGSQRFYQALREMPDERRRLIRMRSVTRINQLYGHEAIDRLHRRDARFVNTCMMVTLSGAAVSDGLEDGTVISGVGGQYNFVEMAQALPDGHSILCLRSTRTKRGVTRSNVVWNHGHTTIPRHLRDVYVTEYGVAFVRGKTDSEIAAALLGIADSRFQPELLAAAKRAGKIDRAYRIPEDRRKNYPETLAKQMAPLTEAGLLHPFPLGSELTDVEQALVAALKRLEARQWTAWGQFCLACRALFLGNPAPWAAHLERMGLSEPASLRERVYRRLLASALR